MHGLELELIASMSLRQTRWPDVNRSIKKEYGLPIGDKGIDLLGDMDEDGLFTFTQVKNFSPDVMLSPSHLKTFIGLCDKLDEETGLKHHRVLCVNDKMSISQEIRRISNLTIKYIETSLIDAWKKYFRKPILTDQIQGSRSQLVSSSILRMTLRNCQRECLDVMERQLTPGTYPLSLACGSGKSVIIVRFIAEHPNDTHLLLVPTIIIKDQFAKLLTDSNIEFDTYGDGLSGPGATHASPKEKGNVSICIYKSISKYLGFSGHHGSPKYIHVDEGHHVAIPQCYKDLHTSSTHTSKTSSSRSSTSYESDNPTIKDLDIIRSMSGIKFMYSATIDDPIYTYDIVRAIDDGILVPFNLDIYKYDKVRKNAVIDLLTARPDYQHVIVFCSKIENAKKISRMLNDNFISSGYITSDMPREERFKTLDDFNNGTIRVLCGVNCLSEGVDTKIADTVIFYDRKNSVINIIQCLGRCLRSYPGKTHSRLVVMVDKDNENSTAKKFISILSKRAGFKDISCIGTFKGPTPNGGIDSEEPTMNEEDFELSTLISHICIEHMEDYIHDDPGLLKALTSIKLDGKVPKTSTIYRYTKEDGSPGEVYVGAELIKARDGRAKNSRRLFVEIFGESILLKDSGTDSEQFKNEVLEYHAKYNRKPTSTSETGVKENGELYTALTRYRHNQCKNLMEIIDNIITGKPPEKKERKSHMSLETLRNACIIACKDNNGDLPCASYAVKGELVGWSENIPILSHMNNAINVGKEKGKPRTKKAKDKIVMFAEVWGKPFKDYFIKTDTRKDMIL